jgi:hypothetical protein
MAPPSKAPKKGEAKTPPSKDSLVAVLEVERMKSIDLEGGQDVSLDTGAPAAPAPATEADDDSDDDEIKAAKVTASQDKDRKKLIKDVSFRTSAQFDAIKDELKASSVYATIQDRDTDALWTRGDCECDPILSASHFHR